MPAGTSSDSTVEGTWPPRRVCPHQPRLTLHTRLVHPWRLPTPARASGSRGARIAPKNHPAAEVAAETEAVTDEESEAPDAADPAWPESISNAALGLTRTQEQRPLEATQAPTETH